MEWKEKKIFSVPHSIAINRLNFVVASERKLNRHLWASATVQLLLRRWISVFWIFNSSSFGVAEAEKRISFENPSVATRANVCYKSQTKNFVFFFLVFFSCRKWLLVHRIGSLAIHSIRLLKPFDGLTAPRDGVAHTVVVQPFIHISRSSFARRSEKKKRNPMQSRWRWKNIFFNFMRNLRLLFLLFVIHSIRIADVECLIIFFFLVRRPSAQQTRLRFGCTHKCLRWGDERFESNTRLHVFCVCMLV